MNIERYKDEISWKLRNLSKSNNCCSVSNEQRNLACLCIEHDNIKSNERSARSDVRYSPTSFKDENRLKCIRDFTAVSIEHHFPWKVFPATLMPGRVHFCRLLYLHVSAVRSTIRIKDKSYQFCLASFTSVKEPCGHTCLTDRDRR